MFQTRHDNGSILDHIGIRPFTLDHEISRQAKFALGALGRASGTEWSGSDHFGVIGDDGNVVAAGHQLAMLSILTANVRLEDLHHIFLGVSGLGR